MPGKYKLNWCRMGWVVAAVLLATSGVTAQPAATTLQRDMVLEGATLIDGTGKAPVSDAVIVVEGNRIKAVGRRGQVQVPAGANVVNVAGRTILPGLLDVHLHTVDWQIPMFLHYGVTTVADQNNDMTWIVAQREALKAGKMQGPRMFVGGSNVEGTDVYPVKPMLDNGFNYLAVTTPAEARAYTETMVAAGVDFIKIHSTLTDDELRAVVQVGKEHGLQAMGHTENIRRAVEIGTKFDEHMWTVANALLDPEDKTKIGKGSNGNWTPEAFMDPKTFPPLIDYMVKQGVFVNPPLIGSWSPDSPRAQALSDENAKVAADPALAFVPADVKKGWSQLRPKAPGFDNVMTFLRQYAKAGGKVVVGTDSGFDTARVPGLSVHQEMQLFVDAGYTPMQVIQAATLWNAQLLKKDKDLGSVEPGKLADILVVDGDPLKDIAATKNIRMVIQGGKVMDTKYDPHWVNPLPAPMLAWEPEGAAPPITVTPKAVPQTGPVTLEINNDVKVSNVFVHFNANSIVRIDNVDLPTHFVSGTKLTATLDARTLQRKPGPYAVYVVNPGIHGVVSKAAYLSVGLVGGYAVVNGHVADTPAYRPDAQPMITPFLGPTPRSAPQGSGPVTITIEGTGFSPNSVVRTDNAALPTHFVSPTKLTATLDAGFLQRAPGGYVIYVLNPGPLGGITKPGYFLVNLKK